MRLSSPIHCRTVLIHRLHGLARIESAGTRKGNLRKVSAGVPRGDNLVLEETDRVPHGCSRRLLYDLDPLMERSLGIIDRRREAVRRVCGHLEELECLMVADIIACFAGTVCYSENKNAILAGRARRLTQECRSV